MFKQASGILLMKNNNRGGKKLIKFVIHNYYPFISPFPKLFI